MQTDMVIQHTVEVQPPTTDFVVTEPIADGQSTYEPHVEEDGVDWCAWWAEYAETLE